MRRGLWLGVAALALAAGCSANKEALEAANAALDAQLARKKAEVEAINAQRAALNEQEMRFHEAMVALPNEDIAEITAMKAPAEKEPEPVATPAIAPPPESMFEGATGAELRARFAAKEARLKELSTIAGQTRSILQRQKDLAVQLEEVAKRRAAREAAKR